MKQTRSIDVSRSRFPELLAARRRELGWSKADLAEKAGLSAKVVHQIEARSRDHFLEKTLLLLAAAVDRSVDDLMGVEPAPAEVESAPRSPEPGVAPANRRSSRRLRLVIALVALAALLSAAPALVRSNNRSLPAPVVSLVGGAIEARDPRSDALRWSRRFDASVLCAEPSPWGDETLLVGLDNDAPDGGRLLLLDGRDGTTIWYRTADPDLAARAFGTDILAGLRGFAPMLWRPVDFRGDGALQAAVSFIHVRNYPGVVMVVGRDGEVLAEYANRGHVYALLAADIDGDGRQELVCGGANNSPRASGGVVFILDHEHGFGAAVDPINGGNLEVADGSRGRVLLPGFGKEILGWLGAERTGVDHLMASQSLDGSTTIIARVGHDCCILHVILDADLDPLAVLPTDAVRLCVAGWPVEDPDNYGPNSEQWRERWLQGCVNLVAGRVVAGGDGVAGGVRGAPVRRSD